MTAPDRAFPSLQELWLKLPEDTRIIACTAFWTGPTKQTFVNDAVRRLAKTRRFRERFVRNQPVSWKAPALAHLVEVLPRLRRECVRIYLIEHCAEMVCAILDAEGTPRDGYDIPEGTEPVTVAALTRGLAGVRDRYPPFDILLYYAYQLEHDHDHWVKLPEAVAERPFQLFLCHVLEVSKEETQSPGENEDADSLEFTDGDEAEDSEAFTTLDRILIRTAVAAAIGNEGAPTPDALEDMIHEVIDLSHDRLQSYFHLGFVDALLGRELRHHIQGANAARRAWNLTGYLLGKLRAGGEDLPLLIDRYRQAWSECLRGGPPGARQMLVESLLQPLLAAGALTPAMALFSSAPLPRNPRQAERILNAVYEKGAGLVREGDAARAVSVLEALLKKVPPPSFDVQLNERMIPRVTRKLGQAHLRNGKFELAKSFFQEALDAGRFREEANTWADLALAEAGFRSLESVLPNTDEEGFATTVRALEAQLPKIQHAFACEGMATNAAFIMGLLSLHRRESRDAECYLSASLCGMQEKESAYRSIRLMEWTEFLVAISLAEACDPSRLSEVRRRVETALQTDLRFPLWLWKRLTNALALYDDVSLVEKVAQYLISTRKDKSFLLLGDTALLRKNETIRRQYLALLTARHLPPTQVAEGLEKLFAIAADHRAYDEVEAVLDHMEALAGRDSTYGARLLAFLTAHRDEVLAVWDETDLLYQQAWLHEREGHLSAARELLTKVFYLARSDADQPEMEAVLEKLMGLGTPAEDLTRLREDLPTTEPTPGPAMLPPTRVLYVGGNEVQERYEEPLREMLAKEHPQVEATFCFPGWSSNWNHTLEKLKAHLGEYDVVVISRFVRTTFGRNLRAACGGETPWYPCTGHGRDSLYRAITRAASWRASRATRMEV